MRKCNKGKPKLVVGHFFLYYYHVRNEKLHTSNGHDIIVVQVANGDKVKKKKYLQFVAIFHLL
jgi:hypothetical protein